MNHHILKIIKHPLTIPISAGVGSFVVGAVTGYILERRKTFDSHVVSNRQEPFNFDNATFIDLGPTLDGLGEIISVSEPFIIDSNDYVEKSSLHVNEVLIPILDEEPQPEVVVHNVFAENNDGWNYDFELIKRTPFSPYVIHKDEFFGEEADYDDYTQLSLTYFEGDNILVDDNDVPIYNHESIVGSLRFGHGSGDPKVFYARNEKNKAEYEIVHNAGLYSVEILGLEIENNERARDLKHSAVQKFRDD
jgi:hypothetical protein